MTVILKCARFSLPCYPNLMNVHLTPDQEAFVRQGIEAGRFKSVEEAVQQALDLWEYRERMRAEILASVDRAEASLARGEGRVITADSVKELAEEIKKRGRSHLATLAPGR
jgi:putative addiction module CopG family antidote